MNAQTIREIFADLDPPTLRWLKKDNREILMATIKELNKVIGKNISNLCPEPKNILHAFRMCPRDNIRIVLIGQDPYPNRENAMGMSFSLPRNRTQLPPSLINIYNCLTKNNLIAMKPMHGDLTAWAQQGVLLLNTALTTMACQSNAHSAIWKPYVDQLISDISVNGTGIIFMLWGNDAIAKRTLIDVDKHHIFTWNHPSPLSTFNKSDNPRNFMYCDHFALANKILNPPINWSPDGFPPPIITQKEEVVMLDDVAQDEAIIIIDQGINDKVVVVEGPPKNNNKRWTTPDWIKLRTMLRRNMSIDNIAADLGRTISGTQNAIIKLVIMDGGKDGSTIDSIITEYNIKDLSIITRLQQSEGKIVKEKSIIGKPEIIQVAPVTLVITDDITADDSIIIIDQPKWSDADWITLRDLFGRKVSPAIIASILHRSESEILAAMSSKGYNVTNKADNKIVVDKRGARWTTDDWNTLREMLKQNETMEHVADKLQRSQYSITRAIPKLIAMDAATGKPVADLIKEFNITNKQILIEVKSMEQINAHASAPMTNAAKTINIKIDAAPLLTIDNNTIVYVAVDGACIRNGQESAVASWAYIVEYTGGQHHDRGLVKEPPMTNNRGELFAFIRAAEYVLSRVPPGIKIVWVYDSEYSYKCLTEFGREWLFDRRKQSGKKNLDIILPGVTLLEKLMKTYSIQFIHIHSHIEDEPADANAKHLWKLNSDVDKLCQELVAK